MTLLQQNGINHSDSEKKFNILNDQFASVFTVEDATTLSKHTMDSHLLTVTICMGKFIRKQRVKIQGGTPIFSGLEHFWRFTILNFNLLGGSEE